MRTIITKLFLPILLTFLASHSFAQTCSGSLGDPIINQTFGSGTNPGAPLDGSITNLNYTSKNCPDDGFYTIATSIAGAGNCHDTWHDVTSDHTGNPNGYMMIINASVNPSVFFTQQAPGLCPNTTYEFSAYVFNLITLAASRVNDPKQGPVSEPDITFSIKTTGGKLLATYNTGSIPPTDLPQWNKYGVYFVTPPDVTDVVVVMTNNAPGGNGNDLILDDIAFRACGPIVQTGFGNLSVTGDQNMCEGTDANYTLTASVGTGYTDPFYQWQLNFNNTGWVNIPGATTATVKIPFTNAQVGTYQYRLTAGEGQNESSPTCNVHSDPLNVIVHAEPKVVAVVGADPPPMCAGSSTTLSASGGLYYKWTPSAGLDHDDIPNPVATPSQTTVYNVRVSNDGCFDDTKSVTVKVNQNPTADGGGNKNVFVGQTIKLNGVVTGDEITSIFWTPTTGLDDPSSPTPTVTPDESITYTLHVVSQSCGIATSDVVVRVFTKVVIPNTFTPNNDGVNDLWNIDVLSAFPGNTVNVFSRYGQVVFQSKGYPRSWDGTFNGKPLPDGTYYYIIDLKNGMPIITGWVLIAR